jgi:hypothetical protein
LDTEGPVRVPVSLEDLLCAFHWLSAGDSAAIECAAYVSRATGKVYWSGEGVDEELPEDIEDGTAYVAVPEKSELELGRSLALRFVEERLPGEYANVSQFFRGRGAYSRFKSLLERAGQLDAWHSYESSAIEDALVAWCEQHGFTCTRTFLSGGSRPGCG